MNRLEHLSAHSTRENPEKLVESMEVAPPKKPVGYKQPPGPLVLPQDRARHPTYPMVARAAWGAGKGYLLDWLWDICDCAGVLPAWRQEVHRREVAEARLRREMEMEQ